MARFFRFTFGVAAYLVFFASFLYLIGFVTNFHVPRSIDVGPYISPIWAVIIDIALIALFGIQHSVMARPGFKAALTRMWPEAIERSLYVALTAAVLFLLFWLWRPLPAVLWSVETEWLRYALWGIAAAGWGIVLISTFLINHFELFGLQQIWSDLRAQSMPSAIFRQPLFYKLVRHPIYTGFLIAFWVTPDMTVGHLLFAAGMSVYIFIGIHYEERDLRKHLGTVYVEYSARVGMVVPGIGRKG